MTNRKWSRSSQNTVFLVLLALTGCNTSFHDLGTPPPLTEIGYNVPVDTVLIPPEPEVFKAPERLSMRDTSIWNRKDSVYFRDERAFEEGDILTVDIFINDSAKLDNNSERQTEIEGNVGAGTDLTLGSLGTLPEVGISGNLSADLDIERGGTVDRTEKIRLQVAAVVTEASSNGNLRIQGSQEIRVNHEIRILIVSGIVRTRDISPDNTIPFEKIAETRITYGGHNARKTRTHRKYLSLFGKRGGHLLSNGS